jgi:hypothetical protein
VRALILPLIASGCLSEASFFEKYAERRCEEFATCVTAETASCEQLTTTETESADCEFDKAAARDCLKGAWTCDTQFEGFEIPVPPSACANVCGGLTGTGTGTGAAM